MSFEIDYAASLINRVPVETFKILIKRLLENKIKEPKSYHGQNPFEFDESLESDLSISQLNEVAECISYVFEKVRLIYMFSNSLNNRQIEVTN